MLYESTNQMAESGSSQETKKLVKQHSQNYSTVSVLANTATRH